MLMELKNRVPLRNHVSVRFFVVVVVEQIGPEVVRAMGRFQLKLLQYEFVGVVVAAGAGMVLA